MGCFVVGTLVHTKEGLKPIEQIKVGDLVLSKPESGDGELSYQPVTRTFEHEDREVYFVAWVAVTPDSKLTKDCGHVVVTGGHPFWVTQIATQEPDAPDVEYGPDYVPPEYVYRTVKAWMNMEELAELDRDYDRKGGSMLFRIQLLDGREAYVKHFDKVAHHRDHLDNPDYGVAPIKGPAYKCDGTVMVLRYVLRRTAPKPYIVRHETWDMNTRQVLRTVIKGIRHTNLLTNGGSLTIKL